MTRCPVPDPGPDAYVIEHRRHGYACCLFWRPEGKGYTCNLDEAWVLPLAHAVRICLSRPTEDFPRPLADMEAHAVRHVPR